jgi:hypothetical protein
MRRYKAIASLIASAFVLFACGAASTALGGGGGGGTPTPAPTATATNTPIPPTPTATPTPNPARYDGTWLNNDSATPGDTELVISNSGNVATVHGYGKCHPTDCDWGTRSNTVGPYSLTVLFDFGGGLTHNLTMQLSGTGLKVVDVGSASGTNTYYFHQASGTEVNAYHHDGTWANDDPNTRGVPQLVISNSGTTLTVHGYGACTPSWCDWGTRSGAFSGDPFVILFDFGGGLTHQLTISLIDSTHMKVTDVGSASGTNTYYFHKTV